MAQELIVSNLKAVARRTAVEAIDAVHDAYFKKGGIRETADSLEQQVTSAAQHVYALAVYAAKQHRDDHDAAESLFTAMCEHAEQEYKRKHNVDNLREALPTWATFKSGILRGMRAGISPLEHRTERKYRAQVMERVSRARIGGPQRAPQSHGPPRLLAEPELADLLASTTVPDTLRTLLSQLIYAAEIVRSNRVEQAGEILRDAWQRLGSLADQRKARVAA